MDRQSKRQRDIERLELRRQAINKRMQMQMARVNDRFDRKQAQMNGELNVKQEKIIAAALELLAEEGLNNLSLRDIAKRINIQAPALYWHFRNKEDLIDYMAEAILQKEFKDLEARNDKDAWQDWLMSNMFKMRKAMLAYPDGGRVVAGAHLYPAVTLAKFLETAVASLNSGGVDVATSRNIIMTSLNYTFGSVIEEQAAPSQEQVENAEFNQFFNAYPNLAKMRNELNLPNDKPDEDFKIGLQYIINGATAS